MLFLYFAYSVFLVALSSGSLTVLDSSPSHMTVNAGKALQLRCMITGVPLPKIQWFRGNQLIIDNSEYSLPDRRLNQKLIINKVKMNNGGDYKCVAHNGLQLRKLVFHLNVNRKKRMVGTNNQLLTIHGTSGVKIKSTNTFSGTRDTGPTTPTATGDIRATSSQLSVKINSGASKPTLSGNGGTGVIPSFSSVNANSGGTTPTLIVTTDTGGTPSVSSVNANSGGTTPTLIGTTDTGGTPSVSSVNANSGGTTPTLIVISDTGGTPSVSSVNANSGGTTPTLIVITDTGGTPSVSSVNANSGGTTPILIGTVGAGVTPSVTSVNGNSGGTTPTFSDKMSTGSKSSVKTGTVETVTTIPLPASGTHINDYSTTTGSTPGKLSKTNIARVLPTFSEVFVDLDNLKRRKSSRVRALSALLALVCTLLVLLTIAVLMWFLNKRRRRKPMDEEASYGLFRASKKGQTSKPWKGAASNQNNLKHVVIDMDKGRLQGEDETSTRIRELDRKGRESRKVIATHGSSNRKSSLADEISFAQSVIVKSGEEREKNYVNSVTRKIIREASGGRRQSFQEELAFAKDLIIE